MEENLSEDMAYLSAKPRASLGERLQQRGWTRYVALRGGQALPLATALLVGAFFLLWRIDQLPPNIVDEPLGGAITAWVATFNKDVIAATIKAIDESRRTQLVDLAFLGQNSLDWFTAWGYLYLYPLAYPLGVAVAAASFWIFGASLAVFASISALAGLSSVFSLYLMGRRMYGPWVGLLAALLLASSFYLLNYLRGPMVTLSISFGVLLAILFMCLLYLGAETNRVSYWWLLGIVGGLAIFNGWMVSLLLPGIALLFLLMNANWLAAWRGAEGKGFHKMGRGALGLLSLCIKGLGGYVMVLALAVAFGVLLSVLWSVFLGLDPFASIREIYRVSIQHRASSVSVALPAARLENLRYFWNSVFVGNTIMEPALKLLLALGIGICLWKRSSADRLVLSWLLVGFGAFALAIRLGAPYYLITVFPGICLAAARPLAVALEWAKTPKATFRIGPRSVPLLVFTPLLAMWLIWTGAKTYDQYFVKQQALGFSADYSQIARFLESASPSEPAAVVYPDYIADMPFEVAFHFAKKPMPFKWFSWRSGENRRKPPWVSFNTFEPEGTAEWERVILTRYSKIFYIVPRDEPWFQQSFVELHPGLAPVKTVAPVIRLDIYEVTTPSTRPSAGWAMGQVLTTNPNSNSIISFRKDNLLNNGSFKEWSGSLPKGWQAFSVTGVSPALSQSREGRNGGTALTIRPGSVTQSVYQDFTAEKGLSYFTGRNLTFGVWAKSKEPQGKMHLQFRVNNSGTMRYRIFDITSAYDFYTVTLEKAPPASSGYRVEIMAGDGSRFNEIIIDDAVLLEGPYCWDGYCSDQDIGNGLRDMASATKIYPIEGYQRGKPGLPIGLSGDEAGNLLQNPSFEDWDNDLTVSAWRPFYSTPEPINFSKSGDSKSGQYAILLRPSGVSQAIYQDFTGQLGINYFTGKKVTFGVWAKSVGSVGAMRLHIRRDNNYTEKIEYFKLTNSYQFFSITSDKLPPGTTGYRVEVISGFEEVYNNVLVDDATVIVEGK